MSLSVESTYAGTFVSSIAGLRLQTCIMTIDGPLPQDVSNVYCAPNQDERLSLLGFACIIQNM